ncbi:deoxyribonuclease-1-like 1 isoform X2 [Perca flavescens]|uniref:deoxyribonuclease-1-like 1 isoform X2 n=1 Tax=Perca flavescens TaxID=8167 RepID=UPI00106EFA3C|nr:deoxyribonuclease-1-like 1 isoform X2 [Perca flavescens]
MDKSGRTMNMFLTELNKHRNSTHPYLMECSESLGRRTHREKFVYFYREDEVKMIKSYQYQEKTDVLAREPYILQFNCPNTVVQNLVLIPVHTKPVDAKAELNALHDVVTAVKRRWRNYNIMILGDFNADGRYLSDEQRRRIRIRSAYYYWLIGDDVDTTTSNSNDHTYDRIVVYRTMLDAVVPKSARPFNFQRAYHLCDADAAAISDHYPVEVELQRD